MYIADTQPYSSKNITYVLFYMLHTYGTDVYILKLQLFETFPNFHVAIYVVNLNSILPQNLTLLVLKVAKFTNHPLSQPILYILGDNFLYSLFV